MADHTPWVTKQRLMAEMVRVYLTEFDGEPPTDEEVSAVMVVLTGYSEVLWLGLQEQGLVSHDKWNGLDGRRFERRYERAYREVSHEGVRPTEAGAQPAG